MKNKKNLGHLSPNQIHVTQEKGTEAPFTGELLYKKDAGTTLGFAVVILCLVLIQNLIQGRAGQVFLISKTQMQLQ